ncbi:carboxymuconolactone decarboxylase family protein [Algoriphagus vanfongensis]|uniref:carboxymuconolactone decarboxylase family protein n=1 Tax=Algoriphagus vanfongensis TaxID=426371 RepID=UPI0003FAE2FD|nr:carboxymuconolactone decarboxylase family protein [Algoriphagus vanfongensis]
MEKRINIQAVEPLAYKALLGLENYLSQVSISKRFIELIKIRSSQLNNCAFCINMHAKDAMFNGESLQRILLLSAWREAPDHFTEEEKVILELTEEITFIHRKGLSSETYEKVRIYFSENEIAQLIMAVVTINSWNRIAVSIHLPIGDLSN